MSDAFDANLPEEILEEFEGDDPRRHHRDPFDRLLVAQAQLTGVPLMTADPKIAQYDIEMIEA